MPASYTIRRSVPRNTRRSKPASTPSTCFPSFSINLFMAFPLQRGDLSSNTTNIIREQETPSPFGCGYAALWNYDVHLNFSSTLAIGRHWTSDCYLHLCESPGQDRDPSDDPEHLECETQTSASAKYQHP